MNNVLSNVIKYEHVFWLLKPSPNNLFYVLIHA